MFGKLIFWSCLAYCLWQMQNHGLLHAIMSGNIPEIGRVCEINGPRNGRLYLSISKSYMRLPID
ncbi:MAG: hypothetical protein K2X27_14930, partial [Candidatus Obscuribacterales bacterium]|nr:hypothetical protein [Candidatus Obscuribacterales bacterium]